MPLIIDREFIAAGGSGGGVTECPGAASEGAVAGFGGGAVECSRVAGGRESAGCSGVVGQEVVDGVRGRLVVWRITESEEQLVGMVTEADRRAVEGYGSVGRRVEALAWRAALRAVVPDARSGYDRRGAPVLAGGAQEGAPGMESGPGRGAWRFISVSHSGPFAAVLLAGAPCGVDIERMDRDFSRAAPRFISPQEAALNPALNPAYQARSGSLPAPPGASRPGQGSRGLRSNPPDNAESVPSAAVTATPSLRDPENIFPAAIWCAKEVLYKLSGREELTLLDDIRITALDLTRGSAEGSVQGGNPVGITFFELDGYLVAWGVDTHSAQV